MVKGNQNVFFAINSADFTIEESPFVLQFDNLSFDVCQPVDKVIPFVYETYGVLVKKWSLVQQGFHRAWALPFYLVQLQITIRRLI
ncbi:hypothetical protein [Muriicola soli]|uniref:hypothetical protein n=1 Tax=Muriicola soli TaxID=2507538 RepID=UPI001FEB9934|nr:hypothetical protein [Muriicola soli]